MDKKVTAVISFGGTRTAYILENNRDKQDPGKIDYDDYINYCFNRMKKIIEDYLNAGGHNLVIQVLDIELFSGRRGDRYVELASQYAYELTSDSFQKFYAKYNLDVSFVGIDAIRELNPMHPAKTVGDHLHQFNLNSSYNESRRKLVWNISAIPLFSIYNKSQKQLNIPMDNLVQAQQQYYQYFSKEIYGFNLPMPDIYIGNNRDGDLPLSTRLPIVIGAQHHLRLFFLPFPSFFITKNHFQLILSDLSKKDATDNNLDYRNQVTRSQLNNDYEKFKRLAGENTIFGLLHSK